MQEQQLTEGLSVSEMVLWETLRAVTELSARQAATRWSLTLGAQHSYEARSMLVAIFQELHPTRIVETGTYHGLTSAFLWKLGQQTGRIPHIMTFDIAESSLAPTVWKTLGASGDVSFNKGDSGTLIPEVCERDQEFVLIDGDHTYSGAERDWIAVQPKLSTRSVVLFDNMRHGGGCGRFFATLDPIWFHPEMAMLVNGFSAEEMRRVLAFYAERVLPLWLNSIGSTRGDEVHSNLESVFERLAEPITDLESCREIGNLCRTLSALACEPEYPPQSDLIRTSARYGIGEVSQARRQRVREALPGWLQPLANRVYRALKRIS